MCMALVECRTLKAAVAALYMSSDFLQHISVLRCTLLRSSTTFACMYRKHIQLFLDAAHAQFDYSHLDRCLRVFVVHDQLWIKCIV